MSNRSKRLSQKTLSLGDLKALLGCPTEGKKRNLHSSNFPQVHICPHPPKRDVRVSDDDESPLRRIADPLISRKTNSMPKISAKVEPAETCSLPKLRRAGGSSKSFPTVGKTSTCQPQQAPREDSPRRDLDSPGDMDEELYDALVTFTAFDLDSPVFQSEREPTAPKQPHSPIPEVPHQKCATARQPSNPKCKPKFSMATFPALLDDLQYEEVLSEPSVSSSRTSSQLPRARF